jgi:hypothetical protein
MCRQAGSPTEIPPQALAGFELISGIDKDTPPTGTVQIAVTFPASGMLAFFCKFHRPLGMNGQLLTGDTAPSGTAGRP